MTWLSWFYACRFLPRCMECRRGLAMRILSVRLSVKRELWDKMEERLVQIFISCERSFSLVFWEQEWLLGATPCTWNLGLTGPRWSKFADFEPIIARSASAVTPSEKSSINANRKSTTRFPMSPRWSLYLAPKSPKGVTKTHNCRFP